MTRADIPAESLATASEVYLALGRIVRALRRVDGNGSLTAGCASALATLTQFGPMRLRELAEAEGVTPPTISRVVAGLESSGYLTRSVDPADARAAVLEVTTEGRELIAGVKSARVRQLAEAMDRLPDEQRAPLGFALTAVERELRDLLA